MGRSVSGWFAQGPMSRIIITQARVQGAAVIGVTAQCVRDCIGRTPSRGIAPSVGQATKDTVTPLLVSRVGRERVPLLCLAKLSGFFYRSLDTWKLKF